MIPATRLFFLLQHERTTCCSRARLCRLFVPCYRAQLVLRVRHKSSEHLRRPPVSGILLHLIRFLRLDVISLSLSLSLFRFSSSSLVTLLSLVAHDCRGLRRALVARSRSLSSCCASAVRMIYFLLPSWPLSPGESRPSCSLSLRLPRTLFTVSFFPRPPPTDADLGSLHSSPRALRWCNVRSSCCAYATSGARFLPPFPHVSSSPSPCLSDGRDSFTLFSH